MNLVIVSSSQRSGSQSAKIAQYLAETANEYSKVQHIELCQLMLPLWDGEDCSKHQQDNDWLKIEQSLDQADALILITPEWGGMASPLLKNFLLMAQAEHCAHKPVLLVSVTSGISGAYPIAELRMNAFKNNKLVAIPDHLIIRNCQQLLNSLEQEGVSEHEKNIRARIAYSMHTLKHYANTYQQLRTRLKNKPFINEEKYCYGM